MCDLGVSTEKIEPKIKIYSKNGVRKCFIRRKTMTRAKVNVGQRATGAVNSKLTGYQESQRSMMM